MVFNVLSLKQLGKAGCPCAGFEFQVVSGHFDEPKADCSSHAGRALSFARALIPLAEGLALPGNAGFVQFGISIHTGTISSETLYGVDWIMFR
jgi:hypothetical protein